MKKFMVTYYVADGSGLTWFYYIVTNPELLNGGFKATVIAEYDIEETEDLNDPQFKYCKEKEIYLLGNVVCVEYTKEIKGMPNTNLKDFFIK